MLQTVSFQHYVPVTVELLKGREVVTEVREGTLCRIVMSDGRELVGCSAVNPKDTYSRQIGRKESFRSAVASLDRLSRRMLWTEFWRSRPSVGNA